MPGVCQAGQCQNQPRDCSALSDQCNVGTCDETQGACVAQPLSDGTVCDDGQFCTIGDTCTAGSCGGLNRDCTGTGDQCNQGVCNESQDACVTQPIADNTPCDDGLFCTTGETCTAGSCGNGTPRVCGAQGGSCRAGTCDETTDQCTGAPLPDGTSCDDGLFCTTNDTCQAGSCTGGAARPCPGDACNTGVCDETQNGCVLQPATNGTTCSDGLFCTVGDQCVMGNCVAGPPRDCSGDACNTGICDDVQDSCVLQPVANGTTCSDGQFCTAGDQCLNGGCVAGPPRSCSGSACQQGVCNEASDLCETTPSPDNTPCDDGQFCTDGDRCQAGRCVAGTADTCDGFMTSACHVAVCDETRNMCMEQPDPMCCNTNVDADLDGVNACDDCDDNDLSNEQDVCQDDMICACELTNRGTCTGNYLCTSFCNSSNTGMLGDGCQPNQYCNYDLLYSANIHGCAVTPDPISATAKRGGEACGADSECRSLNCDKICVGQGCNQKYCQDWCSSDDYCAAGAVCSLQRTTSQIDGRCQPPSSPRLGSRTVGQSCTQDRSCDHGLCATSPTNGQRRCSEACCQDIDCPGGFTCSLAGDGIDAGVIYTPPNAPSCTTDAQCNGAGALCNNGKCTWRISETSPMCAPDVNGQGARTAGQACTTNTQCASNFCERDLGVCIEVCCADSDCPLGQSCEKQFIEAGTARATQARVCINVTTENVLRRK